MFQRGGQLVHVRTSCRPPKGIRRSQGAPRIGMLAAPYVRELLSRCARWTEVQQVFGFPQDVEVLPPVPVVQAIAARGHWADVRPMEGVVETPVLRADGSIASRSGYDEATGLWLAIDGELPPTLEAPDSGDAWRAAEMLLDIVRDFPFPNEIHRAAWLASLLTPLARFAFDGPAPLNLTDGSTPGCGKGLLAALTGLIASGRPMAIMAHTQKDEELEKRITALGLAGDPLVLIDNVSGKLGSPSLDAALTAPENWSGRILGKSEMVTNLSLGMTWYATGNNVALSADTPDRVLRIRLESPYERPRERPESDFTRPRLLDHVRAERHRLTAAALTILRAYHLADRPDMSLTPWGSFTGWSDLVRGAIVWTGLPDPGDTRQELRLHADVEGNTWKSLLEAWEELDPDRRGVSAAELLKLLDGDRLVGADASTLEQIKAAVLELVPEVSGKLPSARRLGNKLRAQRGRLYGGRAFDSRPGRLGVTWVVARAEETS